VPSVHVPDPPEPLPSARADDYVLPAGTDLHRIHRRARGSAEFNPCLGRPARFSPLRYSDGTCVPTAYAASSLEAASHESIFHDIDYSIRIKVVAENRIAESAYSTIFPIRDLRLAPLFQPDLSRWHLNRSQLIDTAPSRYVRTVQWALAIHKSRPDLDGIVWTSRRCDPDLALLLFGDRVASGDLGIKSRDPLDVAASPSLFAQIRGFAKRASIIIEPSRP
jgi:hypothetical protein